MDLKLDAHSRLKPRYVPSSSSSVLSQTSSRTKKSSSIDQFFQNVSPNNSNDIDENNDDGDDDNLSIMSKTIQRIWKRRKRSRKSSKYYYKESPEVIGRFVNVAIILLLLICSSWGIHFYYTHNLSTTDETATATINTLNNNNAGNTKYDEVTSNYLKKRARQKLQQKLRKIKNSEIDVPRLAMKPSRIIEPNPSIQIPHNIDLMFQDITTPRQVNDIPVFWHILKSGGTSMKDLFGQCMAKVEAAEAGIMYGHINDTVIEKVSFGSGIEYINGKQRNFPDYE